MKIKARIFFAICVVAFVFSLFFSIAGYKAQEKALLGGIDQKLYTAALMFKAMLPGDYHDNLTKNSFTQEDYDAIIVAKNNKLCKELGLQDLWSNMVVDGKIIFTTSTSPSKDVSKKDHAIFFEAHRRPEAFTEAFHTMKPAYSSFYNERGQGRMVLIPFVNKSGQPYYFGASMGANELAAVLRRALMEYLLLFSIAIVFGFVASIMASGSFSEPAERLQETAKDKACAKDLREAQEKLIRNEKLAALGKVAGSLSHELRNPLGVISNAIYYLTSPGVSSDNAKLEKYLNIIKSQIRDANNIIETALDFAKPKSMVFAKNNLNDCIEEALGKFVLPKNITIKRNYGQNLNIVFDAVYMRQAIGDVVKNSIEAIEAEGIIEITTSVEAAMEPRTEGLTSQNAIHPALERKSCIHPRECLRPSGAWAKITIADNGKGIDPKDINSIFEPLFSKKAKGIGLGLSIVKDIISAHNGTVTAESSLGIGTKITIKFPIRENV